MTIESDLEEIKKMIKNIKSSNPIKSQKYKAKIQGAGKCQGKERYSIYVTKAVNEGKLTKGDIVEYSFNKIGHKAPRKTPNDHFRKKHNPETASNEVEAAQSDRGSTVSKMPIVIDNEIDTKEKAEEFANAVINPDGTREIKHEVKKITEEEQHFLNRYKRLSDAGKETMASYHKLEAEKKLGKERVEEILK